MYSFTLFYTLYQNKIASNYWGLQRHCIPLGCVQAPGVNSAGGRIQTCFVWHLSRLHCEQLYKAIPTYPALWTRPYFLLSVRPPLLELLPTDSHRLVGRGARHPYLPSFSAFVRAPLPLNFQMEATGIEPV